MHDLMVHVEGLGWWSPGLADWASAAPLLLDGVALPSKADMKPSAAALSSNDRRRAPEPVLLACEAAGQACAMAKRDPAQLSSVFASMHGDIAITHEMCAALATDPNGLSPTKFHNSVHNAPAGYWTAATHCHAASSAVSAWRGSFAAGLFEAAIQTLAETMPVVFAAYDIAARGPLADALDATRPLAVALVLNHQRGPQTLATLRLRHEPREAPADAMPEPFAAHARSNAIAESIPLFVALARAVPARLILRNGRSTSLAIEVEA